MTIKIEKCAYLTKGESISRGIVYSRGPRIPIYKVLKNKGKKTKGEKNNLTKVLKMRKIKIKRRRAG